MKKLSLLVIGKVLVASNGWAFRGGCGLGPGNGTGPGSAANLNLTDDQKAELDAKRVTFAKETNPLRDQLFSRRMELRQLWAQANPDQSKISAKQKELQAIQTKLQEKATRFQLQCRPLLTAEQQEQLATSASYHGGGSGPGWGMRNW